MAESDYILGGRLPGGGLTFHEWHGLVDGFYSGFVWGHRQSDYDEEKHYWRAGYVLGTSVRYGGLAYGYKKFKELHEHD